MLAVYLNMTLGLLSNSHTIDDDLFLLPIKDVVNDAEIMKSFSDLQRKHITAIKDWVFNYLMRPHEEVGRSGPVCPFVPKAVHENSIYFTVICADHFDKAWFYGRIL